MVKKSKGRRIPVKAHTPVIAGRVPEELHRLIKQAAKKSGRTMSDELAYRARMSFQWEATLGEHEQARKNLAKSLAQMTQDNTITKLEELGWGMVVDVKWGGPIYLPPDRHNLPKSGWVDPNKPSPPLPPGPYIIPDPEFVKAIAQPIVAAVKAGLDKEGKK
jgi:hypothetical protein